LTKKNTKYTQINTNESKHSEMGPVRQNPIQKTVRTAHLTSEFPQPCLYTDSIVQTRLAKTRLKVKMK